MTEGRILARNTVLNMAGQAMPIAAALVAIPPLIRGLGTERFAILSLAWAATGYFSFFEFGLARALTQAVAQRIGNDQSHELPAVAWSALLMMLCFGLVGALVLAAGTPFLVTRVLQIPPSLREEAARAFYILAASLPLVLMGAGLRGVLEAHQHFGVVTAVRVPLVLFMFVGPLVALSFSTSLVPAVLMLALGRIAAWAAYLAVCLKRYAFMNQGLVIQRLALIPVLKFGGWTTVSNVVGPFMDFLDRFLVGALLPLAAVAHYVTPYEAIVKLMIVPGAMLGVLYPAFAATFVRDPERMSRLYERSLRVVMVIMFPIALVAVALAHEGLGAWVGPMLPPESGVVLKWLAVGVFINAIGQTPFAALQGAGRPDLIAKLHVCELPLYGLAIWFFVRIAGLPGVAMAWTLRVSVDTTALLLIARRTLGVPLLPGRWGALSVGLMLAAFGLAAALPPTAKWIYLGVMLFGFAPLAWRRMLTSVERDTILALIRRPVPPASAREEIA